MGEMIDLLRANGTFYKANLHAHTTLSDGSRTARQVKDNYRSRGYSIVAFTDHSKYAAYPELRAVDFLPIAGFEAAFTCLDLKNPPLKYRLCHINFLAEDPATSAYVPEEHTYDIGVINRYIADMRKKGWLCTLNHPGWSLQTSEEINGIRGIDGFEVYNHKSHVFDNNGDFQAQYALYLNQGGRAWAVAADDSHRSPESPEGDDTCGGFIMISMPELSYAAFAEAYRCGRFYASTGPLIHALYIDEERDMIVLDCTAVRHVVVKGIHTLRAMRRDAREDCLTHVELPLAPIREREPFFRLELMTGDGQRAYSQPHWFGEDE